MKITNEYLTVEFLNPEEWETATRQRLETILNRLGWEVTEQAVDDLRCDLLQEGIAEQERLLTLAGK